MMDVPTHVFSTGEDISVQTRGQSVHSFQLKLLNLLTPRTLLPLPPQLSVWGPLMQDESRPHSLTLSPPLL